MGYSFLNTGEHDFSMLLLITINTIIVLTTKACLAHVPGALYYLVQFPQLPCGADIILPVLQMRKLRFREVTELASAHNWSVVKWRFELRTSDF